MESTHILEHVYRFVSGIQEHTHKIVRLSSAQLGLAMSYKFFKHKLQKTLGFCIYAKFFSDHQKIFPSIHLSHSADFFYRNVFSF